MFLKPEHMKRELSYVEAVREATDQEMARDPSVIVFGLDVDDPKAIKVRRADCWKNTGRSASSVRRYPRMR